MKEKILWLPLALGLVVTLAVYSAADSYADEADSYEDGSEIDITSDDDFAQFLGYVDSADLEQESDDARDDGMDSCEAAAISY